MGSLPFWGLPLQIMFSVRVYLIGQVSREVVGPGVIEVTGQSHISMTEKDHVGCCAGDEKI